MRSCNENRSSLSCSAIGLLGSHVSFGDQVLFSGPGSSRQSHLTTNESLARFTGKGCHLVADGQALHFWEETKAWECWALENRCRQREGWGGYVKGVPTECQRSAGGKEQGCLAVSGVSMGPGREPGRAELSL